MVNRAVEADKVNRELQFENERNESQNISLEPPQNLIPEFPFSPNRNEYKWKNQDLSSLKANSNIKPAHK